jgi:hypothetical protein
MWGLYVFQEGEIGRLMTVNEVRPISRTNVTLKSNSILSYYTLIHSGIQTDYKHGVELLSASSLSQSSDSIST